jgi:hypothetical protein
VWKQFGEVRMRWHEPVAGFEYETATVVISSDFQRDKLAACGLDTEIFHGAVDPSFFIGEAIHAGVSSGISAEGNVNMLQTLAQHRPAMLDEPLTVRGRIAAVTEVPRGRTIDTEVVFESATGERVISANRRSLKPDPAKAGTRGAGDRPEPVVTDLAMMEVVAEHTLTPEIVKAYSREGNSIHYELEAAQAAGFRAPLIGGGMGVHYLLAHIWAVRQPAVLDLDIYFRRPIFWDERFAVAVAPGLDAICIAKDGKVATEARIKALE